MNNKNPAFTGFFDEGNKKRIDLVLVTKDAGGINMEKVLLNFLMNAIKLGLEIELEQGKLLEHQALIFIKVHAPDAIIEEFGMYFNERSYFKDSHVEWINPPFSLLGMKHERQLIKILRKQYPGPLNYSTLERSMIVYKIFLKLPFGQHKNHFGVNKLIGRNIVLDAFALHDGPYFIAPEQDPTMNINARQVLFYNWVGIINIWRTQPIHIIREYLGKRVAFYFSYYEYFILSLIIPSVVGIYINLVNLHENPKYNYFVRVVCRMTQETLFPKMVCSECRNLTYCPLLYYYEYCDELKFIYRIDNNRMIYFATFISLWGLLYLLFWKRKEKYLIWMWEINEKYNKNVLKPECYEFYKTISIKSKQTGIILQYRSIFIGFLRGFLFLFNASIFSAWIFGLIILSIHMCYFKHWFRFKYDKSFVNWKQNERLYIAMAALMYIIIVSSLKLVGRNLAHILTNFEKHETFATYDLSIAVKLYSLYFSGIFTLLTCYIFMGQFYYTDFSKAWQTIGGFGMLNSGLGTSLDDICITFTVIIIIDQVFFKIPSIFYTTETDYMQSVLISNVPCWEREFKLKNLSSAFFHNNYNEIAIQFALSTLFSLTSPFAPLVIMLMNIWDIRHKARKVLLQYRRPLLLNSSGPGVWHYIIFITAHVVTLFNAAIIVLQSHYFNKDYVTNAISYQRVHEVRSGEISGFHFLSRINIKKFMNDTLFKEQLKKFQNKIKYSFGECYTFYYWKPDIRELYNSVLSKYSRISITRLYKVEFIMVCEAVFLLVSIIMHLLFSSTSCDLKDTIQKEKKIKRMHYINEGLLKDT